MRRAGAMLAAVALVATGLLGPDAAHADPGAGALTGVIDLSVTPGYQTDVMTTVSNDITGTDVLVTAEFGSIGGFVGPVDVDVWGGEVGTLVLATGYIHGTFSGHDASLLFTSGDFFSEYNRVGSVVVGTASGHFGVCAGTGTCSSTYSAAGVLVGVVAPKDNTPVDEVLFTGAIILAGINS